LRRELAERDERLARTKDDLRALLDRLAVGGSSEAATPAAVAVDRGPRRVRDNQLVKTPSHENGAPPRQRPSADALPGAASDPLRSDGVDKCQRAIMTVLIQQKRPLSTKRLATMAVYAPGSGGFKNALSKLRGRGWLEGRGDVGATEKGTREFGAVPKLPSGEALFEHWLQHRRVDKCSRAILSLLRERSGQALSRETLGRLTNYAPDSGGFKNALSRLRTLGLIEGRGEITLAAELRKPLRGVSAAP